LSKAGKSTATNFKHSWITDRIKNAKKNAHLEISDFGATTKSTKQQTDNAVQIFKDEIIVSKSVQKLKPYGGNEFAHELGKKSKEHALDLEYSFFGLGRDTDLKTSLFKTPTYRTDTVAGESAGVFHFASKGVASFTNKLKGNIKAFDDGGAWSGAKTELTEDKFNEILEMIWKNGATPKDVFVGAELKRRLNKIVTRQLGNESAANRRVVSMETDFGTVNIHLHRFLSAEYKLDDVLIAGDFDYVKFSTVWDTTIEDVVTTKTGQAKRIYTEGTWEFSNSDTMAIGVGLN
jgi:hypothetical protein